jgi:iron complex outermembrane receptor protein/outer membrane receptor for ferrienterochelin and colicins
MVSVSLSVGSHHFIVTAIGYHRFETYIIAPYAETIDVPLATEERKLEEVTIISSTRNSQRIENSPLKVEVLGREEMDEENTIKPANIASILGDVSGVQIQQSSAVSGNANVRIQGLEGRYTQILRDGLPLFDGFSGGFGVLSIPPLDLRQVELIKGSASTLYGGGAIGGLVNIISRRPAAKQEGVLTVNQSTLKETNINSYFARRYKTLGYTFFGGYTRQNRVDVNKDGITDLPHLRAIVFHPRLFFYPDERTTVVTGYTGTFEGREGGDLQVVDGQSDAVHQYFEFNKTARHSGELAVERRLGGNRRLEIKGSLSSFSRRITTVSHFFKGDQFNYYTEASLFIPYKGNSFVAGLNGVGDRFTKGMSDPVSVNNFSNNTIGAFAQNTWRIGEGTTVETGLRNDYHFTYGNFFLPRVALFHRFDDHWASRAGVGFGYKTPNPLAPQVIDYAIQAIQPLSASARSETSVGYNLEGSYKSEWGEGNEVFINHAFFLTRLAHPLVVYQALNGAISFVNEAKPVLSKGFDTYVRAVLNGWELYLGYTFTIAERTYLAQNQFIPLTPKHRAAFTLVRDFKAAGWRMGLEGSYNGRQYRFDATKTPDYVFIAALVNRHFGSRVDVVLNCENLLDYRQSKVEPLYTGSITHPEFVPLWGPIEGRVVNLSVKLALEK